MSQIKLNLPLTIKSFVQKEANKYGLTMADYLRHILIEKMEENTESLALAYIKAKEEEAKGKLTKVDDLEKFFEEL